MKLSGLLPHLSSLCSKIGFILIVSALPVSAEKIKTQENRITLGNGKNTPSFATFSIPGFKKSRILHDTDGDGWCDLWCALFPNNPKIKGQDSDGDGMTDYEEMVLMQDPNLVDPLPRHLTAREKMEQERDRKIKQNQNANKIPEKYRKTILEGVYNMRLAQASPPTPVPTKTQKHKEARDVAAILKDLHKPKGKKSRAYQDLKRRPFIPYSYPALMTKADHIWPGGSFPFHDATGAEPSSASPLAPIGVWDDGRIFEPYPSGYNNRIFFGANQTWEPEPHTTDVAQALAHPGPSLESRGIAYEAKLKFYHFTDTYPEMAAEAAGMSTVSSTGKPLKMRFSNHSYGPPAGWIESSQWIGDDLYFYTNWLGPKDLAGEDPEFGAYTWDSKTIDTIIYHNQTYLPVYAAGNDAADQSLSPDGPSDFTYGVGLNYVFPSDTANRSNLMHPHDGGSAVVSSPTPWDVNPYITGGIEDEVHGLASDTLPSTACAKNNLAVGAVYGSRDGENIPSLIGLSHFSSRGPTDDGRVKPDLVGPATFVSPTEGQIQGGGTSLAAPAVTGTLALLEEINHDNGGPSRLASTWKALVLNTAIDCTEISFLDERDFDENGDPLGFFEWTRVIPSHLGPVADSVTLTGPDYFYGWGLIDAEAAADLLIKDLLSGDASNHLSEHYLCDPSNDNDQTNNLKIEIPITYDGTSPEMRVMICWTDPPYQDLQDEAITVGAVDPEVGPADDQTSRLVNNLDLWVVDPNGNIHRPWVLDWLNPLLPAIRGENNRDNVEQVIIDTPIPGTYTIVVSHKGKLKASELLTGTLDGFTDDDPNTAPTYRHISGREQAFSLAISGNLGPTPITWQS